MSNPKAATTIPQFIHREKVCIKHSTGRGTGLFASKDVAVQSQVLFVAVPLILALDIPRLLDTCYQCLRSTDTVLRLAALPLKLCTGCRTVRFCSTACQSLAWKRYHRQECKLYAKLQPRILPAPVRAVVRLLMQHKAGMVSEEEWEGLEGLEGHVEELAFGGGERGENLLLMAQAVLSYSGTELPMEVVLRICCVLMVNSFTLTAPTFDPIGMAMHPLPALINHSCDPNAIVRFDVHSATDLATNSQSSSRQYGSISIHALRPIKNDEEIMISYIDATSPYSNRQQELADRYFFSCNCRLCWQGVTALSEQFTPPPYSLLTTNPPSIDKDTFLKIQSIAGTSLRDIQAKVSTDLSHIAQLKLALHSLAETMVWPLTRYPYPQLRQQLVLSLLALQRFQDALVHSAILLRRSDPEMFPPHHPVRMMHSWTFWNLCRVCATDSSTMEKRLEERYLIMAGLSVLDDLAAVIGQGDGVVVGEFEEMIRKEYEFYKRERGDKTDEVREKLGRNREGVLASAWKWFDRRIEEELAKEAVMNDNEV